MAKAKIYCEVTCGSCGVLTCASTYYKNTSTISKLKDATKDWIWDEELNINLCPECQEELKKTSEEENSSDVFDRWEITKITKESGGLV